MKPGPKIGVYSFCRYRPVICLSNVQKKGYVNRNRKRKKRNDDDNDDHETSRCARITRDKSPPQKQGSMTDGETSSTSTIAIPTFATDAQSMLQTAKPPKDDGIEERRDSVNIQDLSFHLHPSHEASISKQTSSPCSIHHFESEKSAVITRAADAMGLAPDIVENL